MKAKSMIFVSEPQNGKSAYELHFRLLQQQEKGCEHIVMDGEKVSKRFFYMQFELKKWHPSANLITIVDVPKNFDYTKLYNLITNGYTNVFGRTIIPQFLITTEHLPKRNDPFDALFVVYEIKKI
jgi:hypothetical protein